MKGKVEGFVTNVDLGSTPYSLLINKSTSMKSLYCGIISILALVILIYYSIAKLSTLGSVIQYQNHQSKNNPTFNLDGFQLKLYILYINFDFASEDFGYAEITNKNMHEYGFHIFIEYYNKGQITQYKLVDKVDQLNNSYLTLPDGFPTQLYYENKVNKKSWRVSINKCFRIDFEDCNTMEDTNSRFLSIVRQMGVNSNKIEQQQVYMYYDETLDLISLAQNQSFTRETLNFNAFEHYSDLTVIPTSFSKPRQIKSWCYFDKNTNQQKISQFEFKHYEFVASQYTYYQTEKMQKIDQIFPQILTAFSIATLILTTISAHYRNWAFRLSLIHELKKSQRTQYEGGQRENQDERGKVMEINLKNYFKYILNFKKEQRNIEWTSRKIKSVNKKIDVLQISKQVNRLKKTIKAICKKEKIKKQQIEVLMQNVSQSQSQESDTNEDKSHKSSKSSERSLIHS